MIYLESVIMAFSSLAVHKARSALTMLGVIIGTGAVVALVSIGQGASSNVQSRIQNLGTNLLTINAGSSFFGGARGASGSATTLTSADAHAVAKVAGVGAVAPEASTQQFVVFGRANTTTSVVGTTSAYPNVRDFVVQRGAFFPDIAQDHSLPVAVVGATVVSDLNTTSQTLVGHEISINGLPYQVVGVLQPKGGAGFQNPDDQVLVPLSQMQRELVGGTTLRTISVSLSKDSDPTTIMARIQTLLRARHNLSAAAADDFTVTSQSQLLQTFSSVSKTLTYLLGGVAAISLLVGGIGIMNMMLVSVQERTYEIGLRKAVGARRRDIITQFMAEAVILSVTGGAIGVALGIVASRVTSNLAGWHTVLSPTPVVVAFVFAAIIGIVFGVVPAYTAARLDPVTALRHQ